MSGVDEHGFCVSHTGPRHDVVRLIPHEARRILDVGCSTGELATTLRAARSARLETVGIELDPQMAAIAAQKLDRVIVGDVEKIDLSRYLTSGSFDCIVFADILEHLKDPWSLLGESIAFLADEGIIVASIPNVRHYTTILSLLLGGYWPYRERGIHDQTHLRFFTLKNIDEMFDSAGLEIVSVERKYRVIERPHRCNRIARYLAFPLIKDLLAFQYLVVARKTRENLSPNS